LPLKQQRKISFKILSQSYRRVARRLTNVQHCSPISKNKRLG